MKKIAISLFTLFSMVAVVAGGTAAVFTSEARIEGNTVSTANLNVTVSGDPLSNLNLVPSQIHGGWAVFHVTNDSTVPVRVDMHVDVESENECEMLEFYQVRAGYNSNAWEDQASLIPSSRTPIVDLNGADNSVRVEGQDGANYLNPGDWFRVQMRSSMSKSADNTHRNQNCVFDAVFIGTSDHTL